MENQEAEEWLTLQSTSLATMSGKRIVDIPGKATYFGHSFTDPAPLEVGGLPLTSEDIALWILPATAPVQPLELSDHEPAENEWVWIVGQEHGKKLNYYLAKVVKVGGGTFALQQQRPVDTNGFSGGPILTTTGKVIGTTLGTTDQGTLIGTTVTSLRNRITGY